MTWLKLDVQFFAHPKALAAGRDGRDVYLAGLCWSVAQETDGVIPAHALPVVAMFAGVPDADQAASRLVDVGLWITHVEGWQIHGFGDWQISRAAKDEWRTKERERAKRTRQAAKRTENTKSVRAEYARTPREIRDLDVEVDIDIDLSQSGDSYPQGGTRPEDDDEERTKQAMQHVAATLAAQNNARTPAYAAAIIRAGHQLPDLRALAAAHPTDTPGALAQRYLTQTNSPTAVRCQHCNATTHPTERCPTT